VKHTVRWQDCVCYYTNMSMDKQGPYTTVQRGGQNNSANIGAETKTTRHTIASVTTDRDGLAP